jgi:hypothetical protein
MNKSSMISLLNACLAIVFLCVGVPTVSATTEDPLEMLGEMLHVDSSSSNISDQDDRLEGTLAIPNTTVLIAGK